MGGVNLNKKLWRIPQQGMVKGVAGYCALSGMFPETGADPGGAVHLWSGLFTFVAYIVLTFVLDLTDNVVSGEQQPSSGELLDAVDRELAASEKRLREMERYVTSDTFTLRSRFRQL